MEKGLKKGRFKRLSVRKGCTLSMMCTWKSIFLMSECMRMNRKIKHSALCIHHYYPSLSSRVLTIPAIFEPVALIWLAKRRPGD